MNAFVETEVVIMSVATSGSIRRYWCSRVKSDFKEHSGAAPVNLRGYLMTHRFYVSSNDISRLECRVEVYLWVRKRCCTENHRS
jgi:hypothetical protein